MVLFLALLAGGSKTLSAQTINDTLSSKEKKDPYASVGTITFTIQGGVQNITNYIEKPTTGEKRQIIIDDFGSPLITMILAMRFGTHTEGWENINNGFRYNRSNKGFFTDFEFGIKTYSFGGNSAEYASYPSTFTIKHTGGPNTLPGGYTEQQIILGSQEKVGENFVSLLPWEQVVDGVVVQDPSKYADNDYINFLGIDTTDADVRKILESHGVAATKSTTIFFNSYYHFNLFHEMFSWIGLNLGTFFDSSIGLSLRLNKYVDIADFNRFVSYNNDNYGSVLGIISRNYFNFGKKLRWKVSYMFPVVGFFSNKLKGDQMNSEEHILETSVDFYAMPYIYISVGLQYSYFPFNKYHSDYTIRTAPEGGDAEIIPGVRDIGRGITFVDGVYNYGFVQTRRDAWEIYGAVSFDVNL